LAGQKRSFDWYLNAVLAAITGLLLSLALGANVVALISGEAALRVFDPEQEVPFYVVGFVVLVVVPAVFWFWFRMLNDYFRNRPDRHPVAWGWALFLLNFSAALAYFWFVWRPRYGRFRSSDP